MSRSIARRVLAMAALGLAAEAWSQQPPQTHPSNAQRNLVMSWDRSAIPGDIELWSPRTLLAYDAVSPDLPYGASHLVCLSDTDPTQGGCPTRGDDSFVSGSSRVRLMATERRSGLRTEIGVHGQLHRPMTGQACGSDYWSAVARPLWSSRIDRCGPDSPAGIGVGLGIPAHELQRLVAGHWDARLVLTMMDGAGGTRLATYIFTFDLTVTDHDAVSIYFPAFDQTAPHVGLNLQYDAIAQTIGGRAVLDMCLYDGLGSQSQYLGVTVRDTGARPPGATGYSAWHQDGGSDATQRVDYSVTLDHAGTRLPMANGVEQQLRGIDTVPLRLVILPGMTQPVYCVPTPLTLDTPRVPVTSKRPGYYSGDLQVELRLPTSRP